jgi:hypothetical protein
VIDYLNCLFQGMAAINLDNAKPPGLRFAADVAGDQSIAIHDIPKRAFGIAGL